MVAQPLGEVEFGESCLLSFLLSVSSFRTQNRYSASTTYQGWSDVAIIATYQPNFASIGLVVAEL